MGMNTMTWPSTMEDSHVGRQEGPPYCFGP